jgi:hypothetical protein
MKTFIEWFGEAVGDKDSKPSWMGRVDAAGTTPHGTWYLERNSKGQQSIGHDDVTTHIITLVGEDGAVKAYMYVDLGDDGRNLYVNYGAVVEAHRGKGVYKELLSSLRRRFTIYSDQQHNVHAHASKAYERLGARTNRHGQYVLDTTGEVKT